MEIAAIIAVVLVIIGVPVVVVNRDLLFNRAAAKRARVEPPLPFLIIPSYLQQADPIAARPGRGATSPLPDAGIPATADRAPDYSDQSDPDDEEAADHRWMPPAAFADDDAPSSAGEAYTPLELAAFDDDEMDREPSPDATVVFTRPVDEPMQILPGRLQIISGEPASDDLRLFSRMGEPARIIVGRETGPAHQHITLHSPTVSRRHARMDFENGSWTITNLSQTNPVLVNDRVLTNGGSARKLSNGDRIELGEVALRFLSS
jgi:hypothetical protein